MKLSWGFGKAEMPSEGPDALLLGTLEGVGVDPLPDLKGALEKALQQPIGTRPLAELIHPGHKVAIVCPDFHRLVIRARLRMPAVIDHLNRAGINNRDIKIIIANGTHSPPGYRDILEMLGGDIAGKVSIINHDCRDPSQLRYLGKTEFGTPLWVNRYALEADHLILTGGIVPHAFAGYGGGGKAIVPGISGLKDGLPNYQRAFAV